MFHHNRVIEVKIIITPVLILQFYVFFNYLFIKASFKNFYHFEDCSSQGQSLLEGIMYEIK